MKERLITFVCALGALALFALMFLKRDDSLGNDVRSPITSERRGSGYHAAMTWLDDEGIRALSLRERFDTLAKRKDLAPTGNLLIVTLPAQMDFKTAEFVPLDRWVRVGNTLLVMAALSDNPDWAAELSGLTWGDISLLTGLEFESVKARARRLARRAGKTLPEVTDDDTEKSSRAFSEPERNVLVPNRPHAYFEGVRRVIALSDYSRQPWTVKVPYQGFVLALAHDESSGEGTFWTRPLGNGRIIVSGFGSLFTNRAIGLGDNARLLANIVGANVGEQGAVLFDDAHHGVGATYDPDKFFRDRRLYLTAAVLGALWFVWVLGSTRLRLPASREPVPREAELIRAAGGFLSRAVPNPAGARQLIDNFFRRVAVRAGRPVSAAMSANADAVGRADAAAGAEAVGARVAVGTAAVAGAGGAGVAARTGAAVNSVLPWDLLQRNSRISPADVDQLHRWYEDSRAGRRVPLRSLHNLILRLDRQMAT